MELIRIKTKELPEIKKIILARQYHKCPITGRDLRVMNSSNLCVDHCHKNGWIRGVLPRGVNGMEGKVKAIVMRFGGYHSDDVAGIAKCLHGLADYLMANRSPQTEWIHPDHKTPIEKLAQRNAKARQAYAAKKLGG